MVERRLKANVKNPLRPRVDREILDFRRKRRWLKGLKTSCRRKLVLRVAKTVAMPFMVEAVYKHKKLPKNFSAKETEMEIKDQFNILKKSFGVLIPLQLRLWRKPVYQEGKRFEAYLDRERGVVIVDARRFDRATEELTKLLVHEFVHLRIIAPLEPLEAAYNIVLTGLEEAWKHPESRIWMKPIIEKTLTLTKVTVERTYEVAEQQANFLVGKISPIGELMQGIKDIERKQEIEEWKKEKEAELEEKNIEHEQEIEEIREEYEGEYDEEKEDVWDIKG